MAPSTSGGEGNSTWEKYANNLQGVALGRLAVGGEELPASALMVTLMAATMDWRFHLCGAVWGLPVR